MHHTCIGKTVMKDKQGKNRQGEHLEYNASMTPVEGEGKERGFNRRVSSNSTVLRVGQLGVLDTTRDGRWSCKFFAA